MNVNLLDEIHGLFPESKPVVFNYMQARERVSALLDAYTSACAERDETATENKCWNDADCSTCPIKTWGSCDEKCKSKATLIRWVSAMSRGIVEIAQFHNKTEASSEEDEGEAKDRKTFDITGTLEPGVSIETLTALLSAAGVAKVTARTLPQFDDWVKSLSPESMPGLSDVCLNWIRYWGKGGGDYSTEICIRDAIRELKSDVPAELAMTIYGSVAGYSKSSFEAIGLTMTMVGESISELLADTEDERPEEQL